MVTFVDRRDNAKVAEMKVENLVDFCHAPPKANITEPSQLTITDLQKLVESSSHGGGSQ